MKILKFYIIPAIIIFFLYAGCSSKSHGPAEKAFAITDDTGAVITFSGVPRKVISLAPSLTEMIFSLGAGDKLAGNTIYCTYPPEAKLKEKVGDLITVDYEKILSLKPDLILISVEGNVKDTYNRLKELGFKVMVSNPRNFEGIKKTYSQLGTVLDKKRSADSTIYSWDKRYALIRQKLQDQKRPSGMFIVGLNPLMLAGKNTFINEILTSAGINNIANDQPVNYPLFSREEILLRNPDYIITTGHASGDARQIRANYREWSTVSAVKNNNIILVDEDRFLRPGPRFIDALEELYGKLYADNTAR
ncbi:MAG: ABC transporter substrate-binding protein [Bacteroidota bacterium]